MLEPSQEPHMLEPLPGPHMLEEADGRLEPELGQRT